MSRPGPGRAVFAALASAALAAACAGSATIDRYTAPTPTAAVSIGPAVAGPGVFDLSPAPAPLLDPSPLPVDDDVRIGTLDNGLTYLLRSNDAPGASLDLRLVVDAGSAQQAVGNDGSAHFLEHMLFNGTEKFPGNELSRRLERLGISFGPDLNAFTTYDETVYVLTATTLDPEAPDLAFEVLAQWAAAATLDPAEVAAEVGVVRDELRQRRESVDGIIFDEFERIYTAGTPYEGHAVIGDPTLVEATDASTLRQFYDRWYRPDNMAVVVVGDLPVEAMETRVHQYFDDLTPRLPGPPPRDRVAVDLSPEPRIEVVSHPDNAVDNLSLDFPVPPWDRSTVGGDRLLTMEDVIVRMLTNRLSDAFQRGDLVLDTEPRLEEFSITRGLRYLGTNIQAPDLLAGFEDWLGEILGAAADGFTPDALDRARVEHLAELDDEAARVGSTQDWQFADDLTAFWLEGADLDDPASRIERHRKLLAELTIEELTDHWRWLLNSGGPIVVAVGADPSLLPTTADLLASLEAARPAGRGDGATVVEQLMARPERVAPVSTRSRATANGEVHEWRYGNGATVSFQFSPVEEGVVALAAAADGGWSALPPDSPGANTAVSAMAAAAVARSGVGELDAATVRRFLQQRAAGVSAFIDETEEGFVGRAAGDDVDALFQLLHQSIVAPRVDDVAFRTTVSAAERAIAELESDADLQAEQALAALASGDMRHAAIPTPAQLETATADALLDIYRARFGGVDDLHVALVGDLQVAEAGDLSDRYVGSLPTRPPDTFVDLGARPPTGVQRREVALAAGASDAGLIVAHFAPASLTARETAASEMLRTIIDSRITDEIREELAASYGGAAELDSQRAPVALLRSVVRIDGDPDRLDTIRDALLTILDELATAGPTDEEFATAVRILADDWTFVDNRLFLTTNLAATRYPDADRLTPDNRLDILAAMTVADVRSLAADLYGSGDHIEIAKVRR